MMMMMMALRPTIDEDDANEDSNDGAGGIDSVTWLKTMEHPWRVGDQKVQKVYTFMAGTQ